ncbi:MAG TPA: dTMP kinase [Candidatus Polarisedimenticolia bacterium]|jgi:dTMP kinase|nr:dTMP kinase [Candidatus Polarisedimenticolia bacterium]
MSETPRTSRFITFEGVEGSGKTTQIQMLSNHLEERGIDHLLTREPGGTPIGDQIRRLVLDPRNADMTPICELLLYAAARAQHIEQVIRPALLSGRLVLCDRFKDATMAYQGSGRGIRLDLIDALHGLENLAIQPDLTILFDLEEDTALKRARVRDHTRTNDETRFERESLEFHKRVRSGYLDMARQEPGRFVVVDAHGTVEEVHHRVIESMDRFLTTRGAPE